MADCVVRIVPAFRWVAEIGLFTDGFIPHREISGHGYRRMTPVDGVTQCDQTIFTWLCHGPIGALCWRVLQVQMFSRTKTGLRRELSVGLLDAMTVCGGDKLVLTLNNTTNTIMHGPTLCLRKGA